MLHCNHFLRDFSKLFSVKVLIVVLSTNAIKQGRFTIGAQLYTLLFLNHLLSSQNFYFLSKYHYSL